MSDKKSDNNSRKSRFERLNFLAIGKYFLLLVIIAGMALAAYKIIDRNYEKIYLFIETIGEGETVTYQMDELIVNPAGTQGKRFLVVELSVELPNESYIERFDKNKQEIRHHMNESLSARTVDQLITFEEREILRRELAGIIDRSLGEHSVRNLYYTRYVMQ